MTCGDALQSLRAQGVPAGGRYSIELLKQSGINFAQNEARGIEVQRFGEVLMSSGIVLNDKARGPPGRGWASHTAYLKNAHGCWVCAPAGWVLAQCGLGSEQ